MYKFIIFWLMNLLLILIMFCVLFNNLLFYKDFRMRLIIFFCLLFLERCFVKIMFD